MVLTNQQIDRALGVIGDTFDRRILSDPKVVKERLTPIMQLCCRSTKLMAKVFFPERFSLPFSPKLHDKIFAKLDDDSIDKLMVLAPRGIGKTSIIQLAYPARKILYNSIKFLVPVSCSATQSIAQTESLKRELKTNIMIKKLFGSNLEGDRFAREQWETSTGICVMPRGRGQQIRGILYRDYRPNIINFDDLEDSESVRSEEQRPILKRWFYEDALLAFDLKTIGWRANLIGTVLHEDALTSNILREYEDALKEGRTPEWEVVHLAICDEKFNTNWPEAYPQERLNKLVGNYRSRMMMDSFAREYMNLPVSADANFKKEYFKEYKEPPKNRVETVLLIDPAKTVKAESADTAMVVVGIDVDKGELFVRDVIHGRFYPDELATHAFRLALQWKARVIAYEVTGIEEFINYLIKNEMSRRGLHFELVELKARGKKEDRIAGLLPFYRQGMVYHSHPAAFDLEMQLISYPRSHRWDIMDAFAHIVDLMEVGGRYFMPSSWTEDPSKIEDEYKELEKEDLPELDESWMIA